MKGHRKLLLTGIGIVAVILIELFGGDLSERAHETIRWLAAAFAGGNGLEWVGSALTRKTEAPP